MSRLNNDVVGAQNAISNTIVDIVTNLIEAIALLAVMLTLEWRLTLVSVLILPLIHYRCAKAWQRPARYCPQGNGNERADECAHERDPQHRRRAAGQVVWARDTRRRSASVNALPSVRDIGIRRAVVGSSFFVIIGLVGAVGTALVYGLGGYYVITGVFTIGTIVAFGSYLGQLYGALQGLAGAPV